MQRLAASALLACALFGPPAAAQGLVFPTGPITLVVPLAPGDAADIAARALGEEISKQLKTPVLAINRAGAGGAVGAQSVVQGKKDGHTILFAQNSALTFRAVLDPQSVSYDALRDLVPLGTTSRTPSILVVRSDAPYRNLPELIDYAKKNPGKLNYSEASASQRLSGEMFNQLALLPRSSHCVASTSKASCCRWAR